MLKLRAHELNTIAWGMLKLFKAIGENNQVYLSSTNILVDTSSIGAKNTSINIDRGRNRERNNQKQGLIHFKGQTHTQGQTTNTGVTYGSGIRMPYDLLHADKEAKSMKVFSSYKNIFSLSFPVLGGTVGNGHESVTGFCAEDQRGGNLTVPQDIRRVSAREIDFFSDSSSILFIAFRCITTLDRK